MEGLFFLLDVALVGGGGVLAFATLFIFGGARRNALALVVAACYMVSAGVALSAIPMLYWPVVRQDNAFLGHFMLTFLALAIGGVLLAAGLLSLEAGRRARALAVGLVQSLLGLVPFVALLIARGPDVWRTGSGQFGLDVIAAGVAIGAVLFFVARRQGEPAAPAA